MNAEEVNEEESKDFQKSVQEFGQAHAATQAAIQALTANNGNLTNNVATSISALQQQMHSMQTTIQNLAMAGTNRPPNAPPANQLPPLHNNSTNLPLNNITLPPNTNNSSSINTSPPTITAGVAEDAAVEEVADEADKEAVEAEEDVEATINPQ